LTSTDSELAKRAVAESCGIGGVRPISDDPQRWVDRAILEPENPSAVSVTYALDVQDSDSDISGIFLCIREAMEGLMDIVAWLQESKLCCNSFTVLSLLNERDAVEVITIPFVLLKQFDSAISSISSEGLSEASVSVALEAAQAILAGIYGPTGFSSSANHSELGKSGVDERTAINFCALATQSLCLGLLSHSNAHVE
jgi:hypothetical protein